MCTAISYKTRNHYFGRNLDLEHRYQEAVTISPRNYPFVYKTVKTNDNHFAMIGMASVINNYPLYYEATNEHGLSMAGLNFPGNAEYLPPRKGLNNIAPFEFIPWVLGQCKTVEESRVLLSNMRLVNIPFSNELPLSPLHWMISDSKESLVVEPMESGLKIYDNPVGVLTNNPPFDYHLYNLCNYLNLTHEVPVNRFTNRIDLKPYSRGMGSIGLPGDLSSSSRFIKASFVKLNSVSGNSEEESISQFFHILGSVAQQQGCVKVNGEYEKTVYSSCCNTDKGIYYYTTYENSQISGINLFHVNLDSNELTTFPLITQQNIYFAN